MTPPKLRNHVPYLVVHPHGRDAPQCCSSESLLPHPAPRGYGHRSGGYGRSRWETQPCEYVSSHIYIGMRLIVIREAFDQREFVLDGPALRFGGLLGSGICQLVGPGVATADLIYLSICSGEAPCFRVICREKRSLASAIDRLELSGSTDIVHGRHLEILH